MVKQSRKNRKWNKKEIVKELKVHIKQLGNFPNTSWLGLNDKRLLSAINYHFGGLRIIAKKIGYLDELNSKNVPLGYWQKWENVENCMKELMKETKIYPTTLQIMDINPRLLQGIANFGGMKKVARKMGIKFPRYLKASDGHFLRSTYEYYLDELLYKYNIKHSVDGYINRKKAKYRYDFLIGEAYVEIWGYAKTKYATERAYASKQKKKEIFYKENNLKYISLYPKDFRGSLKNISKRLKNILEREGINFDKKECRKSIEKNELNIPGYWTKKRTIMEIKKAINKYDDFPQEKWLRKDGNSTLGWAINKYGGINYFRKLLGYKVIRHYHNYWNDITIIKEIRDIIIKCNKFPSSYYLKQNDYNGLVIAIVKNGGFDKYRKLLGYIQ